MAKRIGKMLVKEIITDKTQVGRLLCEIATANDMEIRWADLYKKVGE